MPREPSFKQGRKEIDLTCRYFMLVCLSRAKRDSFTLECVLRTFWDCKLNSILSRFYRAVALAKAERRSENKIEFFCRPKCALTAGSLTSTYRVVNTTF